MSNPPTDKETPQDTPLRTPRNGKGKLRVGNPGNKGGGRTPDAIRATLRAAFDKRIPMLQGFVDDETLDAKVRMQAAELLAKYGLGTTFTQTGDDGKAVPTGIAVTLVRPVEEPNRLRPAVAKHLNGNGSSNGHNGDRG